MEGRGTREACKYVGALVGSLDYELRVRGQGTGGSDGPLIVGSPFFSGK